MRLVEPWEYYLEALGVLPVAWTMEAGCCRLGVRRLEAVGWVSGAVAWVSGGCSLEPGCLEAVAWSLEADGWRLEPGG